MSSPLRVRICEVVSTRWKSSAKTKALEHPELSPDFQTFYLNADERERPDLIAQEKFRFALRRDNDIPETWRQCERAEVVLFTLPYPAKQVVSVLVLDFEVDSLEDLIDEPEVFVRRILRGCADSQVLLDEKPMTKVVDALAKRALAEKEQPANGTEKELDQDLERHALVFSTGERLEGENLQDRIAGLLYGIHWPFQQEFTHILRPADLNRERGKLAAVTAYASFFHGQNPNIENSVILTTVQAVGTAARFQRIWRDAYFYVEQFQLRQTTALGRQHRWDLEVLADELGNLELDLAFSVQTAADLGLGSTRSRIDAFHDDLYAAMQIVKRAKTVSEMFERVDSSIRSELTAIESREKEISNRWRLSGGIAIGVITVIIAPLTIILAFFGISENWPKDNELWGKIGYGPHPLVYWVAGLTVLLPVVFVGFIWMGAAVTRVKRKVWLYRRARGGGGPRRS